MDFDFTTETITPDSTNILTIGGSGGLEISIGSTAERPVSPINGTIRYNTTLSTIEGYSNDSWTSLIGIASIEGTANQISVSTSGSLATLSIPSTFIAPGSLQYTSNFGYPIETLAAAGTTQATATLISITTSLVTSGAAGSGVILPAPSFDGEIHAVTNKTSNIIYVYPNLGSYIDSESINSPAFISPGLAITFVWDGTHWVTIQNSISSGNAGIGITSDQGNIIISNNGVLSFSGGTTGLSPVSATTGAITLGGTLTISNGGTSANNNTSAFNNLSPAINAGDLIYHNGTNNVRLPIGSNTQVLSVNNSNAPVWISQSSINAGTAVTSTTSTNLAGGTAGSVPYQTAAGTTSFIAVGTSSQVLVSGTTPSFVSIPTALGYTPLNKAGDTMSGTLNMGSNYITDVLDPVNAQDAATKAYVDSVATGLEILQPVRASTTGNLSATYNNGTAGVGATLTNNGTQAALALDGVNLSTSDRVLVKNQTSQLQNGIYTVTTVGDSSTNWVLTRSTDFDEPGSPDIEPGDYVLVLEGSTHANTGWVQTASVTAVGTDSIIFEQFSSSNTYTAGTGLQLSGNQFSNTGVLSNVAGTGISVSSSTGNVTITNTGVTSVTAGTGISVSASTGSVTISATSNTNSSVKTANYTVTSSDYTIFADGSAGGFTVTLPATPTANEIHNIKKIDETRSVITISGNGFNIDKYSNVVINVPFVSIMVQWNPTSNRWQII